MKGVDIWVFHITCGNLNSSCKLCKSGYFSYQIWIIQGSNAIDQNWFGVYLKLINCIHGLIFRLFSRRAGYALTSISLHIFSHPTISLDTAQNLIQRNDETNDVKDEEVIIQTYKNKKWKYALGSIK